MKEQIEIALDKITPGKWKLEDGSVRSYSEIPTCWIADVNQNYLSNGELIANAPEWLRWQNERIEQLERALEHIQFDSEHAQFVSLDGANNFREYVNAIAKEALGKEN